MTKVLQQEMQQMGYSDKYRYVASLTLGVPYEKVTDEQRQKVINEMFTPNYEEIKRERILREQPWLQIKQNK